MQTKQPIAGANESHICWEATCLTGSLAAMHRYSPLTSSSREAALPFKNWVTRLCRSLFKD